MSVPALRWLRDVRMADVSEVGGKAAGLGELFAVGARVPDGAVMSVAAALMDTRERQDVLRSATDELGGGPFAVRSSGIAEDGAQRSFAGMYETVLDVAAGDLSEAVDRVVASAGGGRAIKYGAGGNGMMAVIIQRMVTPAAAGVVLTADPITGDRDTSIVTAVRGLGERLVSGAALGDDWVIRGRTATARRRPEKAINRRAAITVAREARRIAVSRGVPQDIEWAIDGNHRLWLLQARPMTALPPEVSWEPSAPGAYTRQFRFGEWISEPVTPLFESWLLPMMEERMHASFFEWVGQRAPPPHHVVVNGWYFYSLNWLGGPAFLRNLPRLVQHIVREPRRVAGLIPPTVRHSIPVFEGEWRDDLQPRYRAAVEAAEARVETTDVRELPALIDGLATLAGEYFASLAALGGGAYKMEMNLAGFYRRHLARSIGGSHLPLVTGLERPTNPRPHSVTSLDWWHPPAVLAATRAPVSEVVHNRLVGARQAAEQAALAALAPSPKRMRSFQRILADAQHLVRLREEQVDELTLAWPVLRRTVLRIGESFVSRGLLSQPDDVFFLTRDETEAALGTSHLPDVNIDARRATRQEQADLVPPLLVGRLDPLLRKLWDTFPKMLGAAPSDTAIVTGSPASAGRASGPVRVVRGPQDFGAFLPGEILVAPLTAPAWTPLFMLAAAVVTDVGSPAAHASVIAREYGIPAVVGCGDATARLRTGMRVTVDGTTGNVEPE